MVACGESGSAPESSPAGVPAPAVLEVRTVAVERGTIAQRISAPGSLDANGWSVDQEMNMMGQRMLHASKGGRSLMVQVMERDGGSHAMVHLGEDG